MSMSNRERKAMIEDIIRGANLYEKIKLYLDIYVGDKSGHTLLDIAKQLLFFDQGMNSRCLYCQKGGEELPLEKRIFFVEFLLKDYLYHNTIGVVEL